MRQHTLIAGLLLALALPCAAQVVHLDPLTGDVWVDQRLNQYDRYASQDRQAYLDQLQREFGGDRRWYEQALSSGASAGDVYYACELGREVGRSCAQVLEERQSAPGQGWGVIAQRHGIQPGSEEFHRMKSRMRQQSHRDEWDEDRDREGERMQGEHSMHHHEMYRDMQEDEDRHDSSVMDHGHMHHHRSKPHHGRHYKSGKGKHNYNKSH